MFTAPFHPFSVDQIPLNFSYGCPATGSETVPTSNGTFGFSKLVAAAKDSTCSGSSADYVQSNMWVGYTFNLSPKWRYYSTITIQASFSSLTSWNVSEGACSSLHTGHTGACYFLADAEPAYGAWDYTVAHGMTQISTGGFMNASAVVHFGQNTSCRPGPGNCPWTSVVSTGSVRAAGTFNFTLSPLRINTGNVYRLSILFESNVDIYLGSDSNAKLVGASASLDSSASVTLLNWTVS